MEIKECKLIKAKSGNYVSLLRNCRLCNRRKSQCLFHERGTHGNASGEKKGRSRTRLRSRSSGPSVCTMQPRWGWTRKGGEGKSILGEE